MDRGALELQLRQVRVLVRLTVVLPPLPPVVRGRPGEISPEKTPPAVAAEVFVNVTVNHVLPQILSILLVVPVVTPAR